MNILGRDLGELLECPRWHAEREKVSFVDIPTGRLFEVDWDCQTINEFSTGVLPLGAALPFESGYLLVGADDIWFWNPSEPDGPMILWASIPHRDGTIPNDAFVHDGCVWVGRLAASEEPGKGSVWRISPGHAQLVVSDLTLPNGMVLAQDSRHMLLAESVSQRIFQIPLDARNLAIEGLETFADLNGWTPDGLAWDNQSHLWVARWGDACISCISDPGAGDVALPTPQVTALAFDPEGSLFVTTGREGFSEKERIADPQAGSFFTNSENYRGAVSPRSGGSTPSQDRSST